MLNSEAGQRRTGPWKATYRRAWQEEAVERRMEQLNVQGVKIPFSSHHRPVQQVSLFPFHGEEEVKRRLPCPAHRCRNRISFISNSKASSPRTPCFLVRVPIADNVTHRKAHFSSLF